MNLSISNATKNKLLVLLFLIFILNTIFIAIASNNQQNDAIQINVAGQQRLLLRTIETHILAINMTEEHHSDLIMSRSQFEQNHIDIRFGNKEKNIKPIKSQGSIQLFTSINDTYYQIRPKIIIIEENHININTLDIINIRANINILIDKQDELVNLLQNESVQNYQKIFLSSLIVNGFLILIMSITFIQDNIISRKDKQLARLFQQSIQDEENLRNLIQATNDGIIIVDKNGEIINYNTSFANLLQYNDKEIDEKTIFDIWKFDNEEIINLISGIITTQTIKEIDEAILIGNHGTQLIVTLRFIFIIGMKDPSLYIIIHDQTKRKKIEQQYLELTKQLFLTQKREALGKFAGEISHEVNNLLTVVQNYVELIKLHENIPVEIIKDLNELKKIISTHSTMATRILKLNKGSIELSKINIGEELQKTSDIMKKIIPKNISFSYHSTLNHGFALINEGLLNQIILNLIGNSVDAVKTGGKIEVFVRKSTLVDIELFGEKIDEKYDFENERNTIPFLTIQITDTGAGIPEHIGDRIFESFYSTKEKGTGLGLAVVKSIIDNFKGYITYKSKQNFGTSFYILLPLITT